MITQGTTEESGTQYSTIILISDNDGITHHKYIYVHISQHLQAQWSLTSFSENIIKS